MGKFGPIDERLGTPLYPGFYRTTPPGFSRLQRLETGAQRLQRGVIRPTSGNYVRMPKDILHTKPNSTQLLDLSKTQIKKIGGVSVSGNTAGFAYTATTSSITWYWDGTNGSRVLVITRADGSKFTVPTSGSGLTVSGLSSNTTYYFLPFWSVNNTCNIGWVPGTHGSPQIAFVVADTTDPVNNPTYCMQQTLQGREALTNAYMTAATTAAGSGGGGAGGGGGSGSGCVRSGTVVKPLGEIDFQCDVLPETDWIYLETEEGKELFCTCDHPLYHAVNGKVEADTLVVGDLVITDEGEQKLVTVEPYTKKCSKYRVRMATGHLFFANGFLSHNKFLPP